MIQQSHSWAFIWRKPWCKSYMFPTVHWALFTIAKTWKHPQAYRWRTDKEGVMCICLYMCIWINGLRWWLSGKDSTCHARDQGLIPGLGQSPGGGHGNPLQYSCLENPHGQRSLMGCSQWGCKESDTTEQLSTAHMHKYMCIRIWDVMCMYI